MYLEHWKLSSLPFEEAPDPAFFFPAQRHREGVERLRTAILDEGATVGLVTGDYGVGKTVVCRTLARDLADAGCRLSWVCFPALGLDDLLKAIVRGFGEQILAQDHDEILRDFGRFVEHAAQARERYVVIIDDAHRLPEATMIDDLKRLVAEHEGEAANIVLLFSGHSELEARAANLEALKGAGAVACQVPPFSLDDAARYVGHRLTVAGGSPEIFTDAALAELQSEFRGYPRELNNCCDLCLLMGFLTSKTTIGVGEIREAARERV